VKLETCKSALTLWKLKESRTALAWNPERDYSESGCAFFSLLVRSSVAAGELLKTASPGTARALRYCFSTAHPSVGSFFVRFFSAVLTSVKVADFDFVKVLLLFRGRSRYLPLRGRCSSARSRHEVMDVDEHSFAKRALGLKEGSQNQRADCKHSSPLTSWATWSDHIDIFERPPKCKPCFSVALMTSQRRPPCTPSL
jgi:hypothetical protein